MFSTNYLPLMITFAVLVIVYAQEISFPESANQRIDSKEPARVPLYAPHKCPDNHYLWPGDQESDWICDCAPGFLFYPPSDGCFAAYRQGPCQIGHILVLNKSETVPECVKSKCKDGLAWFQNQCHKLDSPGGPCRPVEQGGGIFGVNVTTLELECLKGTDRLSLFELPKMCPLGSRRDNAKQCRDKF